MECGVCECVWTLWFSCLRLRVEQTQYSDVRDRREWCTKTKGIWRSPCSLLKRKSVVCATAYA